MPYRCPCPDSNESAILYKAKHKKKETELHVGVTSSGGAGVNLMKPTLLKCNKCNLIFSEYIDVDFEDAYSHVVDESYINQIKFKTKTFELFFSKIRNYLNQNSEVLEIGSYYGILGNIIKSHVKNYMGLELSKHATQYSKKKFNLNITIPTMDVIITPPNEPSIVFFGLIFFDNACLPKILPIT